MKKRLFLSSAIMTAVLAGALTTGTFAWYSANSASVSVAANQASNIVTKNTSSVSGETVTVNWSGVSAVNPSKIESDGSDGFLLKMYTVSGVEVNPDYVDETETPDVSPTIPRIVASTTQADMEGHATFTFGTENLNGSAAFDGTYRVYVYGTSKIRVTASSLGYVDATDANYIGESKKVEVGKVTFTNGAATYTDLSAESAESLECFYSIVPESYTGAETSNAGANYGTLVVVIEA